MSVTPITNQIPEHGLMEAIAILDRQPCNTNDCVGIFGVDVEDRCVKTLCQVCGEARTVVLEWLGGEADQVIDDQVDTAADRVCLHVREPERFGHHSLPGKGRVAVDENREDPI